MIKKTLITCPVSTLFRRNHMYNILLPLFFWKKKVSIQNALTQLSGYAFNLALFPLVTKVFIIQLILMVFLKTKGRLQHEVTTNLDSTVITTGWEENVTPHCRERSGLTCTVRWSSASGEGSAPHEPSPPANSAFSL